MTAGTASPTIAGALAAARERLCAVAAGESRLESELLLAEATRRDRAQLIASLQAPLARAQAVRFDALLARRLAHEPLAYILGRREFYGIEIACDRRALIPRPETELLVDLALAELRARGAGLRVVDVGTGSGAIACAIAARAPAARVTAVDASSEALGLARENVGALALDGRVGVRRGELLDGAGVFDAIVANLPYVSEAEWRTLQPEVRDFEPKEALVPGPAGTEAIARLVAHAPAHLAEAGLLALEIGATQAAACAAIARARFPGAVVSVMKDLAGHERVLVVRR